MIRALVAALLVAATTAQADVTYQGLTLGAPMPETVMPHASERIGDKYNADVYPLDLHRLCEHKLFDFGGGSITVVTNGCDGAVLRITVDDPVSVFFDPDKQVVPVETQLDGLVFQVTTLAEGRARFGSEGLIAPRWFGPDRAGQHRRVCLRLRGCGHHRYCRVLVSERSRLSLSAPDHRTARTAPARHRIAAGRGCDERRTLRHDY